MNCYRVYTIARSTVRRIIRRIVRHTHPAWVVTIVCVGVPLAAMPFVSMIPATTQAQASDGRGGGDGGRGDDHHPQSVPCPGALVVVPGVVGMAMLRRRKSRQTSQT